MTRNLPTHKHNPVSAPRDLGKLYDRVVDALYKWENRPLAQRYAGRLRQLVEASDPRAESAFTEECLSLAHEAEGDLEQAIRHREAEIALIRRLHQLAQGPDAAHADLILSQYSYADLRDRLIILAMLHREYGDLDNAINALLESKRLSEGRVITFDADDLLAEYLNERNVTQSIGLRIESDNGSVRAVTMPPEKMKLPRISEVPACRTPILEGQRLPEANIVSVRGQDNPLTSSMPKRLPNSPESMRSRLRGNALTLC